MTASAPSPQPQDARRAALAGLVQSETSGIDWLTLTWPRHASDPIADEVTHAELAAQRDREEKLRPWKALGFEGIAGTGIKVGSSADMRILIISGETAGYRAMSLLKSCGRPTRLDIASTLLLCSEARSLGSYLLGSTNGKTSPNSRPRKRTFTHCTAGSFSASIGSRTSETYIRVYDKGVEQRSHKPGVRWRAEVEFKAATAQRVWRAIQEDEPTPSYFSSLVSSRLRAAGGWYPLLLEDVPRLTVGKHRVNTDPLRALQYLRKYCRRMTQLVIAAGMLPELLDALGISEQLLRETLGPKADGPNAEP